MSERVERLKNCSVLSSSATAWVWLHFVKGIITAVRDEQFMDRHSVHGDNIPCADRCSA